VKAFIEALPQIVHEYKDEELVTLLLFNLPWLCHGKVSQAASAERSETL
jgi:hypothetical protein